MDLSAEKTLKIISVLGIELTPIGPASVTEDVRYRAVTQHRLIAEGDNVSDAVSQVAQKYIDTHSLTLTVLQQLI